ncbi:MAG: hypothetical protein JNL54_03875 [Kineosporiaceae bacterium]|nr:hypothetical protein [Kineosporiaceae bacterium]
MTERNPQRRPPEDVEAMLRRALAHEAATVHPPERLEAIRARITTVPDLSTRRGRRVWLPLIAAASVLALAILTPSLTSWVRHRPAPATGAASPAPLVEPLPVYYLQGQRENWRIVREFTPTTVAEPAARVQAAVRLAVAGRATDPDYTSLWRRLDVTGPPGAIDPLVTTDLAQDVITIRLDPSLVSAHRARPGAVTAELARLTVDQLIWTATAAAGRTLPVTITTSAPPSITATVSSGQRLFGLEALGTPAVRTTAPRDPRAPIWVNSLTEGQQVSAGSAITVTGDLDLPLPAYLDAPLTWTLSTAEGEVRGNGDVLVSENLAPPERSTWLARVTVPERGRYVVSVTHAGWTETKLIVAR